MKNLIKSISLLAISAFAFASCQQEIDSIAPSAKIGTVTVEFGASAQDPATKVTLGTEDDTNFSSAWETTDQLYVEYEWESENETLMENDLYVGEGTFTSEAWNGTSFVGNMDAPIIDGVEYPADWTYKCYYPAPTIQYSTMYYSFGASRTQNGSSPIGQYDIMVGGKNTTNSCAGKDGQSNVVFNMDRMTSIAYFHITTTGFDADEKLASATLTILEDVDNSISADDICIAAETVYLYPGDKDNEPALYVSTEGSTSITLTSEQSISDFKLWFNVLPVAFTKAELTLTTASEKSLTLKMTAPSGDLFEYEVGEVNKAVIGPIPADSFSSIEPDTPAIADEPFYTLTFKQDGNSSSYASIYDVVCDGISWKACGNLSIGDYLRVGGKSITGVDRTISSSSPFSEAIKKVVINHNGTTGEITINSIKVQLSSSNTFSTIDVEKTISAPDVSAKGSLEYELDSAVENAYVRIIVNCTVSGTKNKGFDVTSIDLYEGAPAPKFNINVAETSNGSITPSKTTASEGSVITITATPDTGYELVSLSVINASTSEAIELTNGNQFTMPAANVSVSAQFGLIPTLTVTDPEPFASNTTNNSNNGFSIPVVANQPWTAKIKDGDENNANITLIVSEGNGGENENIVFVFNSQNTDVINNKTTTITVSPKSGNRPAPIDVKVVHSKRSATLMIDALSATIPATQTSYTATITSANFSEWGVLEYTIGGVQQTITNENCIVSKTDNTGTVVVNFDKNSGEINDRTIIVKIGYSGIVTKTVTITQSAAVARTPNATLDFSSNTWGLPTANTTETGTYSDGTTSITVSAPDNYKYDSTNKYLFLGKQGACLTFQSFDYDVDMIKVYGRTGASSSVAQNIYVGETAVSTETTGATTNHTYQIASNYQSAGNVYALKITSNANTQITKIEVFGGTPKTVSSVSVSGTPAKTSYLVGESFDPKGLDVTVSYEDGTTIAASGGVTWNITPSTLANNTTSVSVTATYRGVSSNSYPVSVTVSEPLVLSSIEVVTPPTKVTYIENEKFNPAGLVIKLNYSDGSSENVTYDTSTSSEFTFTPSLSTALSTTNSSVTISYGGKSCTQSITVDKDLATTVTQSSFTSTSGNLNGDANISYSTAKGNGTTNPAISSSKIRLYKPATNKSTGGLLTITANNGKKIKEVIVKSNRRNQFNITVDGSDATGTWSGSSPYSCALSNLNASTIVFTNVYSDSNDISYISVKYE